MSRYRTRARRNPLAGWVLCPMCLVGLGCRPEEPVPSPAPPPGGGASVTQTSAPVSTVQTRRPLGVDDQDDPDAPRALPKTNEIRGWVKTRPVESVDLDDLIEDDSRWAVLKSFPIRLAARSTYELQETTARVVFVEAATSDDAFGIFSLLSPQPGELAGADRSVRAIDVTAAGIAMSGWQGEACVQIQFTGPGMEQNRQACEQLLGRILFNLPAADPPLLMRMIPPDKRVGTKVVLVRSVGAFATTSHPPLLGIDAAGVDARLGLHGDATLSLATVRVADDEPPNLIWLVQYQDSAEAAAAYERYQPALQHPATDLDANTIIQEPKGTFLAGSWTADQESIQNLLPRLREALPE